MPIQVRQKKGPSIPLRDLHYRTPFITDDDNGYGHLYVKIKDDEHGAGFVCFNVENCRLGYVEKTRLVFPARFTVDWELK